MKKSFSVAVFAPLLLGGFQWALAQTPAPRATPRTAPASAAAAASVPAPSTSALTAGLFYQLLLGELAARSEDPGTGFSLILDAARKTSDPALYQRAVEIAMQARSGESALQAARAWRQALPTSRDANRFVLQILLALNRTAETLEPLKSHVMLAPASERVGVIFGVPRLYARVSDKKLAATTVEQALTESLAAPATGAAAWAAVGRVRLAAADGAGALEAARRAQTASPRDDSAALLALELMATQPAQAEPLVRKYLEGQPTPPLRMAYARALLEAQRLADAREQLSLLTRQAPQFKPAWLAQGLLQLQDGLIDAAAVSLQRFVSLSLQARTQGEDTEGEREDSDSSRSLTQAYLGLAQVAEKRGDLTAANGWLDKIQDPQDLVAAQSRRASILARQGRLEEGRQLLRALPERNANDARMKTLAEANLLRDAKQFQAAYDLLAQSLKRQPGDPDLLYEQATMADKLGRYDDMERLLRQLIAARPDFHHAYNALGYSLAERNVRLPEAREWIIKALEQAPGDPFITDSLGWVEFRLGNKTEALRLLELAYKGRPDAEIAAHLGEVLWSLGQRDRAQSIWKEGLLLNRENETLQETLKRLRVKP